MGPGVQHEQEQQANLTPCCIRRRQDARQFVGQCSPKVTSGLRTAPGWQFSSDWRSDRKSSIPSFGQSQLGAGDQNFGR